MGLGDTTTCVHQFIFDSNGSNGTKIIQKFIMHGLGLGIRLDSFVAHMFYEWSLSHNEAVPIAIK